MTDVQKYKSGDLADVEVYCGVDVADALLDALAGIQLYIPKTYSDNPMLAKLSRPVADKLIASFGGGQIYVSRDEPIKSNRDKVSELHGNGLTPQEIAIQIGVSQTRVYQILAAIGKSPGGKKHIDDRQMDMFTAE